MIDDDYFQRIKQRILLFPENIQEYINNNWLDFSDRFMPYLGTEHIKCPERFSLFCAKCSDHKCVFDGQYISIDYGKWVLITHLICENCDTTLYRDDSDLLLIDSKGNKNE